MQWPGKHSPPASHERRRCVKNGMCNKLRLSVNVGSRVDLIVMYIDLMDTRVQENITQLLLCKRFINRSDKWRIRRFSWLPRDMIRRDNKGDLLIHGAHRLKRQLRERLLGLAYLPWPALQPNKGLASTQMGIDQLTSRIVPFAYVPGSPMRWRST